MPEKIYAPITIKEISTKYGVMLKVSFRADKMQEFMDANKNAKGYVNLDVNKRKNVGQYGETHSAVLDTWQPNQPAQPSQPKREPLPSEQPGDDNIPF
jgi:hypothetical protein